MNNSLTGSFFNIQKLVEICYLSTPMRYVAEGKSQAEIAENLTKLEEEKKRGIGWDIVFVKSISSFHPNTIILIKRLLDQRSAFIS